MKKVLALLLVLTALGTLASCRKKEEVKGLQMTGSYYENLNDFKSVGENQHEESSAESASGVVKAYLQGVIYEIKKLDEKNMLATVEVTIPDFGGVLEETIGRVVLENEGKSFEELLALVHTEMETALLDENTRHTTAELTMAIEEVDDSYQLVYNEQWTQLVFGNMEQMYVESFQRMLGGEGYEAAD